MTRPIQPPEANAITRAIMATWPQPQLDQEGFDALAVTLHATGMPLEALEHGVLALRLQAPQFRPVAEILTVARRYAATLRTQDADVRRRIDPGPAMDLAQHLANLAITVGAVAEGRRKYSAKAGVDVGAVEHDSMRHVSSLMRIGTVDITGRQPFAEQLIEELLTRSETAEAKS